MVRVGDYRTGEGIDERWHSSSDAVNFTDFRTERVKEGKQAEFLLEYQFPWELVSRIGVYSRAVYSSVVALMDSTEHKPPVQVMRAWYY